MLRPRTATRAQASLAVLVLVLAGSAVIYLERFREGYLTDLDESRYMSVALYDTRSLLRGPRFLLDAAVHASGTESPLVPLTTVPLHLLLGRGVISSLLVEVLYLALLVVATYGIARRLMSPGWAWLAALCVGSAPVVSDFTHAYHFAVPAAALFTAGVWAMLRSDGLARRRWALLSGALLGLAVLARTMVVGYLPGVGIGGAVLLYASGRDRRRRTGNFVLLWLAAVAVVLPWLVPNAQGVASYLWDTGYGSSPEAFGTRYPVLSLDFWTKELRLVVAYLYLPLAAGLVCCVGGAILTRWSMRQRGSRDSLAWRPPVEALVLAIIVLEGYLALTSTANEGGAFFLPWLPALVVLALCAAANAPVPAVRGVLAGVVAALSILNLAMKNGLSEKLAADRSVRLPVIGEAKVTDGRDYLYQAVAGVGYSVSPPPSRLPALARSSTFDRNLTRWLTRYAHARDRQPVVEFASFHPLFTESRLQLASELWLHRRIGHALRPPRSSLQSVDYYRQHLGAGDANFLITMDPTPLADRELALAIRAGVERAARTLGFRQVRRLTTPDRREMRIWWKRRGPDWFVS